jgi:hypothetical protein
VCAALLQDMKQIFHQQLSIAADQLLAARQQLEQQQPPPPPQQQAGIAV